MRLLRFRNTQSEQQSLSTRRLQLCRPELDDYEQWARLRHDSSAFLRPFEPSWTKNELSVAAYRLRMKQIQAETNSARALHWFLKLNSPEMPLLGGITLSNIKLGAAKSGTLGYWMGERYAGQGFMGEAVDCVCDYAFKIKGLNRIEASTLLDNERSIGLLLSRGFQREGIGRQYLKINGEWCDHILFARLASD